MLGQSISRYELKDELGHGGMSTVYRAHDSALGRTVAIKLLHEHLARRPENRARFHREARAIASLHHPNILEIYDFAHEQDDRAFIVMEYVPGANLREFVDAHGTPPPEVGLLICLEICEALQHAHEHGIIHRDLKPENVMVSETGEVKLMDFGIAHIIDAETMTKTGSLLGSPGHMAPELIDGGTLDERVDVFSLGTVLYWLTTGSMPFTGDNAPQVLRAVMESRYVEPEVLEPKIGHRIAALIERAMDPDPGRRFRGVAELSREMLAVALEGGLEAPKKHLEAYFKAPKAFSDDLEAGLIEALTRRGLRMLDAQKMPDAMGYFNRVLAYDPQSQAVARALTRLDRRRRWRRAGHLALALTIVAGLAAVWLVADQRARAFDATRSASHALSDAQRRATAQTSLRLAVAQARSSVATSRAHTETQTAATGYARRVAALARRVADAEPLRTAPPQRFIRKTPSVKRVVATPVALATGPARPEPVEKVAAQRVTYKFLVKPTGARFTVNGREVNPLTAAVNGVELDVGERYRLVARADACLPYRAEIVAESPGPVEPMPILLDYREGGVAVTSNRPSVIFVDGRLVPNRKIREPGGTARIDFPFGRAPLDNHQKKVRIKVARADDFDIHREQVVQVSPGQLRELNFQLP